MEIIAAVLYPLVKFVAPSVAKRWEYLRNINKNMADLRESLEKLKAREADYKRKLEAMVVSGEIEVVNEVKLWLERVEKYNCDVDEIGNKVAQVKFFSRASLGKRVSEMKLEVEKHYGEGEFADDDLVRVLPLRGNVKQAEMILGGLATTRKMTNEILECLADENVKRIGLHGMGGIGKTTVLELVHNDLLKSGHEIRSKFDKVIWITVTRDCCLTGLQDKIASELGMSISKDDDEEKRATTLFRKFNENKKSCVLILDDMWEAYPLKKVGIPKPTPENGFKLVLTTRSHDICSKMECDRIIEMGVLSEQEAWKLFVDKVGHNVASKPKLHEIVGQVARECPGVPLAIVTVAGSLRDQMDLIEWEDALDDLKDAKDSTSSEITALLRFSYDRLNDKNLKDCLLYCALYPEDCLIERNLLIDQLIAEAIVEETNTRQSPARKGHIMLNNLVRNCLLIETKNHRGEKCVKLHDSIRDMAIQICIFRFVANAGLGLESLKPENIWDEHVEKVSLMGNKITEIPFTEPPKCPRLSTLLLSENYKLERLSEDFFLQMEGLCVLDLSWTNIQTLPKSVSVLVNLAVLSLTDCRKLVHVPDLSDLRNLRRLDLYATGITEVPKGMETLEKLTYLDLSDTKLQSLPKGIICKLSNLHFLSLIIDGIYVTAEELVNLRKLETLRVSLAKFEDFDVQVGGGRFPLILPENVENLGMEKCFSVQSLCCLTSVENISNLVTVCIILCTRLECLFYHPLPPGSLSSLKRLEIRGCDNLKKLLVLADASLPNLEEIDIGFCDQLEEIITSNKEADDLTVNNYTVTLPKLKKLSLWWLPKLKSIPFVADSLKSVEIMYCQELKSIFFLDGDQCLPSLQSIEIDAEPWRSRYSLSRPL